MIEIIPAIDIIDGVCVRLTKGDYNSKRDYGIRPVDMAKQYEGVGITRLHIVDLDGAKASKPVNLKSIEEVCDATNLKVQFGGGIKSTESVEMAYAAGVYSVICGSVAITNPELFISWLKKYGGDRVILGADIKDGNIAINGWLESGDKSINQLLDYFLPYGLKRVVCTDISKDGMLQGPNFELYRELQESYPTLNITVSGGISTSEDIDKLNEMELKSVIVGKAIYEGKIELNELKRWLPKE